MNGVDTNILVRYLVQDDPEQSRLATQLIEKRCSVDSPVFISGIVLCELVWVLETAYEYEKEVIVPVLEKILRTRQFHIHESQIAWHALEGYKKNGADFSDHYIGHLNIHHGCKSTFTFDKKASKLSEFKHL